MWVTKQLLVVIVFHSMEKRYTIEVNGYQKLLTTILQNIIFCIKQKKESH